MKQYNPTLEELLEKWQEEADRRQRLLDECFGGGKFGGSVLKTELLLIREFLADMQGCDEGVNNESNS